MAEMREALVLEDRFTAAFNRYITLAEQGTASTQELDDAAAQASKNARLASAAYETAAFTEIGMTPATITAAPLKTAEP